MKPKFCRCCGDKSDHTFDRCANYSAMRKIIKDQDDEMHGYLSYRTQAQQYDKERTDRLWWNKIALQLIHERYYKP